MYTIGFRTIQVECGFFLLREFFTHWPHQLQLNPQMWNQQHGGLILSYRQISTHRGWPPSPALFKVNCIAFSASILPGIFRLFPNLGYWEKNCMNTDCYSLISVLLGKNTEFRYPGSPGSCTFNLLKNLHIVFHSDRILYFHKIQDVEIGCTALCL